eukprot:3102543-Amphidinium_carterae.1
MLGLRGLDDGTWLIRFGRYLFQSTSGDTDALQSVLVRRAACKSLCVPSIYPPLRWGSDGKRAIRCSYQGLRGERTGNGCVGHQTGAAQTNRAGGYGHRCGPGRHWAGGA